MGFMKERQCECLEKCPSCSQKEREASKRAEEEAERKAKEEAIRRAQAERNAKEEAEKKRKESFEKKQRRSRIRKSMEAGNIQELNVLLERSQNNLENQMESGEIPVVGWINLSKLLEEIGKKNAEEMEKELEEIEKQIKSLQDRKEKLEKELEARKEGQVLKSKIGFDNLAEKEKHLIEQFNEKIDTFQNLEVEDVSTLFSLFNLDHLFPNCKENEPKIMSFELVDASLASLQSELDLELNEALEMFSKFQLVKEGIKSFDDHLSNCRICQNKNVLVLLKEYGADLNDVEEKMIKEKIKDWKGYFLVSDPRTLAQVIALPATITRKVAGAVRQIRGRHR